MNIYIILLELRISFDCRACRGVVSVDDVNAPTARCRLCGEDYELVGGFSVLGILRTVPGDSVFDRAVRLEEGGRVDGLSGAPNVHVSLLRHPLRCLDCGRAWSEPVAERATTQGALSCGSCGAKVTVMAPPAALGTYAPRLRCVLQRDADGDGREAADGVVVRCGDCGAALEVKTDSDRADCRFCGRQNLLARAIATRGEPAPKRSGLFFVATLLPHEIEQWVLRQRWEEMERRFRAAYDHDLERALVDARNPSSPIDVLHYLARHSDHRVRAAVAQNQNVPTDLLLRFAGDQVPVAGEAASHPRMPDEALAQLTQREELREAIARHPTKGRYLWHRMTARRTVRHATAGATILSTVWLILALCLGSRNMWVFAGAQGTTVILGATVLSVWVRSEDIAQQEWRPVVIAWAVVAITIAVAILTQVAIYSGWGANHA